MVGGVNKLANGIKTFSEVSVALAQLIFESSCCQECVSHAG